MVSSEMGHGWLAGRSTVRTSALSGVKFVWGTMIVSLPVWNSKVNGSRRDILAVPTPECSTPVLSYF